MLVPRDPSRPPLLPVHGAGHHRGVVQAHLRSRGRHRPARERRDPMDGVVTAALTVLGNLIVFVGTMWLVLWWVLLHWLRNIIRRKETQ